MIPHEQDIIAYLDTAKGILTTYAKREGYTLDMKVHLGSFPDRTNIEHFNYRYHKEWPSENLAPPWRIEARETFYLTANAWLDIARLLLSGLAISNEQDMSFIVSVKDKEDTLFIVRKVYYEGRLVTNEVYPTLGVLK